MKTKKEFEEQWNNIKGNHVILVERIEGVYCNCYFFERNGELVLELETDENGLKILERVPLSRVIEVR